MASHEGDKVIITANNENNDEVAVENGGTVESAKKRVLVDDMSPLITFEQKFQKDTDVPPIIEVLDTKEPSKGEDKDAPSDVPPEIDEVVYPRRSPSRSLEHSVTSLQPPGDELAMTASQDNILAEKDALEKKADSPVTTGETEEVSLISFNDVPISKDTPKQEVEEDVPKGALLISDEGVHGEGTGPEHQTEKVDRESSGLGVIHTETSQNASLEDTSELPAVELPPSLNVVATPPQSLTAGAPPSTSEHDVAEEGAESVPVDEKKGIEEIAIIPAASKAETVQGSPAIVPVSVAIVPEPEHSQVSTPVEEQGAKEEVALEVPHHAEEDEEVDHSKDPEPTKDDFAGSTAVTPATHSEAISEPSAEPSQAAEAAKGEEDEGEGGDIANEAIVASGSEELSFAKAAEIADTVLPPSSPEPSAEDKPHSTVPASEEVVSADAADAVPPPPFSAEAAAESKPHSTVPALEKEVVSAHAADTVPPPSSSAGPTAESEPHSTAPALEKEAVSADIADPAPTPSPNVEAAAESKGHSIVPALEKEVISTLDSSDEPVSSHEEVKPSDNAEKAQPTPLTAAAIADLVSAKEEAQQDPIVPEPPAIPASLPVSTRDSDEVEVQPESTSVRDEVPEADTTGFKGAPASLGNEDRSEKGEEKRPSLADIGAAELPVVAVAADQQEQDREEEEDNKSSAKTGGFVNPQAVIEQEEQEQDQPASTQPVEIPEVGATGTTIEPKDNGAQIATEAEEVALAPTREPESGHTESAAEDEVKVPSNISAFLSKRAIAPLPVPETESHSSGDTIETVVKREEVPDADTHLTKDAVSVPPIEPALSTEIKVSAEDAEAEPVPPPAQLPAAHEASTVPETKSWGSQAIATEPPNELADNTEFEDTNTHVATAFAERESRDDAQEGEVTASLLGAGADSNAPEEPASSIAAATHAEEGVEVAEAATSIELDHRPEDTGEETQDVQPVTTEQEIAKGIDAHPNESETKTDVDPSISGQQGETGESVSGTAAEDDTETSIALQPGIDSVDKGQAEGETLDAAEREEESSAAVPSLDSSTELSYVDLPEETDPVASLESQGELADTLPRTEASDVSPLATVVDHETAIDDVAVRPEPPEARQEVEEVQIPSGDLDTLPVIDSVAGDTQQGNAGVKQTNLLDTEGIAGSGEEVAPQSDQELNVYAISSEVEQHAAPLAAIASDRTAAPEGLINPGIASEIPVNEPTSAVDKQPVIAAGESLAGNLPPAGDSVTPRNDHASLPDAEPTPQASAQVADSTEAAASDILGEQVDGSVLQEQREITSQEISPEPKEPQPLGVLNDAPKDTTTEQLEPVHTSSTLEDINEPPEIPRAQAPPEESNTLADGALARLAMIQAQGQYTKGKYAAGIAAYERNTGKPFPSSTLDTFETDPASQTGSSEVQHGTPAPLDLAALVDAPLVEIEPPTAVAVDEQTAQLGSEAGNISELDSIPSWATEVYDRTPRMNELVLDENQSPNPPPLSLNEEASVPEKPGLPQLTLVIDRNRESDDEDEANSLYPEAPDTPKSNLGINSPTFDTRSEISAASRVPTPPKTPQLDPLETFDFQGAEPLEVSASVLKQRKEEVVLPPEIIEAEPAAQVVTVESTSDEHVRDIVTPTELSSKAVPVDEEHPSVPPSDATPGVQDAGAEFSSPAGEVKAVPVSVSPDEDPKDPPAKMSDVGHPSAGEGDEKPQLSQAPEEPTATQVFDNAPLIPSPGQTTDAPLSPSPMSTLESIPSEAVTPGNDGFLPLVSRVSETDTKPEPILAEHSEIQEVAEHGKVAPKEPLVDASHLSNGGGEIEGQPQDIDYDAEDRPVAPVPIEAPTEAALTTPVPLEAPVETAPAAPELEDSTIPKEEDPSDKEVVQEALPALSSNETLPSALVETSERVEELPTEDSGVETVAQEQTFPLDSNETLPIVSVGTRDEVEEVPTLTNEDEQVGSTEHAPVAAIPKEAEIHVVEDNLPSEAHDIPQAVDDLPEQPQATEEIPSLDPQHITSPVQAVEDAKVVEDKEDSKVTEEADVPAPTPAPTDIQHLESLPVDGGTQNASLADPPTEESPQAEEPSRIEVPTSTEHAQGTEPSEVPEPTDEATNGKEERAITDDVAGDYTDIVILGPVNEPEPVVDAAPVNDRFEFVFPTVGKSSLLSATPETSKSELLPSPRLLWPQSMKMEMTMKGYR